MNQLFYMTLLNEIYDRKAANPWGKRGKNRWLNICARECDAITVLNKIMDACSRKFHGYVIMLFTCTAWFLVDSYPRRHSNGGSGRPCPSNERNILSWRWSRYVSWLLIQWTKFGPVQERVEGEGWGGDSTPFEKSKMPEMLWNAFLSYFTGHIFTVFLRTCSSLPNPHSDSYWLTYILPPPPPSQNPWSALPIDLYNALAILSPQRIESFVSTF